MDSIAKGLDSIAKGLTFIIVLCPEDATRKETQAWVQLTRKETQAWVELTRIQTQALVLVGCYSERDSIH